MKTKYFILAAIAAVGLASCADDVFVGDNSPNVVEETTVDDGAIRFGLELPNATRGDIYGKAAADKLGNGFYVTGTKGTEGTDNPSEDLVFDNYLVHYGVNTAGTTESNTANWEYVGITPGTGSYTQWVKLSDLNTQTIKYWDYNAAQYDFLAFSTGEFKAVSSTNPGADEIGVTKMIYGTSLSSGSTAYTFYLPNVAALEQAYITDIVEVEKGTNGANYGKEVTMKFKNLAAKVRVALYETVPGYSVKDVKFYAVEGLATPTDLESGTSTTATLISNNGIPTKGTIAVNFLHVGSGNDGEADYDKASVTVTPGSAPALTQTFGVLTDQLIAKERDEVKKVETDDGNGGTIVTYPTEDGTVFLGRTLTQASFAGSSAAQFYQTVFPVTASSPLVLRVDYTLVPIDGARETIKVKGAKAVVPSTYTVWQPNYAYTYIFKISDNTNGWTGLVTDPSGLFPITFDAVVAEITDAEAEQTTITTVATPTITTYQQGHNPTYDRTTTPPAIDEYSKSTKGPDNVVRNLYVQVMDNSTSPATLKGDLNGTVPTDNTDRSLLYVVTNATGTNTPISEATVMDALENYSSMVSNVITGRNGIVLTPDGTIDAEAQTIVNGPDDNPITKIAGTAIAKGQVAEIDMTSVSEGTYAYVYDYSTTAKKNTVIYQPIAMPGDTYLATGTKYVDKTDLGNITVVTDGTEKNTDSNFYDFIYFSKTTDGEATPTYSFVSVDGKTTLPAGLIKCPVSLIQTTTDATTLTSTAAFVFTVYTRNDGKYAVKVIQIVD